jgi:hypothetical protein
MATLDPSVYSPFLGANGAVPVAPTPVTPAAAPAGPAPANNLQRFFPVFMPAPANSVPAGIAAANAMAAAYGSAYGVPAVPATQTGTPAPVASVATPPNIQPVNAAPASAAPPTASTPVTPDTAPQVPIGAAQPRQGADSDALATVNAALTSIRGQRGGGGAARAAAPVAPVVPAAATANLPAFAPGTPDLSQAPNSVTYDDNGNAVGGRNAQGVEIIRDGVPSRVGGGGGTIAGRFVNPSDAIANGYAQQLAYQRASIANLLDAFSRSDGLAATKAALAHTIGLNNFGSVQGQGVNTINSAIGGIAAAGQGAGAAMYNAELGLAGRLAEIGEQHYQAETGSIPVGTTLQRDPATGLSVPVTVYGQRPSRAGQMPTLYDAGNARQAKPQVGKQYVDKNGNRAVYNADGTYTPVK